MAASNPCGGVGQSDCSAVAADVAAVVVDVVAVVGIAAVERAVDEDCGTFAAGHIGTDKAIGVHRDCPLGEDSLHCHHLDEDEMGCVFAVVARIEDTVDSVRMADVGAGVDNLSAAAVVAAVVAADVGGDVAAVVAHGGSQRWLDDSSEAPIVVVVVVAAAAAAAAADARDEERARDAGCYLLDLARERVGLSLEFRAPVIVPPFLFVVVVVDMGLR